MATDMEWTDPSEAGRFVRARKIPAWSVSLAVHIALLVLLGVLIRPGVPKGLPSGDRPGGIVLAQVKAEQTEYVSPEAAPDAAAAAAAAPSADDVPPEATSGIDMPAPLATLAAPSGIQVGQADASGVGRPTLGDFSNSSGKQAGASIRQTPRFSGPVARLKLFGSGFAEGNSFVFVIDRSKSMGNDGLGVLAQAKLELTEALSALDRRHKFQIVAYHHDRVYLDRAAGLLPATDQNKARVSEFFEGLAAFGGTNHELAVFAALGMKPDVVFLLTDGGSPGLNRGQLEQIITIAKRMHTTIHCIQFGFSTAPDRSFMLELARRTGGSYRYIQR